MIKLTGLDSKEIPRYTYDEVNNANRVVLIGGDFGVAEAVKEGLKDLKVTVDTTTKPGITETVYLPGPVQKIEVPVIVRETEYKEITVPVIQTEVRIIEVEKPIIQKELEIQRIEVPVLIKEKELQMVYVDRLNYKMFFILQALTLGLILLSKLIK